MFDPKNKELALMIAVARGTPLATAKAALDAAFPDQAAPKATDVVGTRHESIPQRDGNGNITGYIVKKYHLMGDGSSVEI